MEKVYRLLPWLNMAQALTWLHMMTGTALSEDDLLQLCDAEKCAVYIDCRGWNGARAIDVGEEVPVYEPVTGRGFCKVEYPLQLANPARHGTHVIGPVRENYSNKALDNCEWWIPSEDSLPVPMFKNADIGALAGKMNRAQDQPSTAEAESLRQQLEQERAARQAAEKRAEQAEAKVDDLQNKLRLDSEILKTASGYAEHLNQELQQVRGAKGIAEQRAKKAEAEAAALRFEIEGIYAAQEAADREAADEAHQRWLDNQSSFQPEVTATGLTFPYATKHLEAMRDAALEYWQQHDRSKPAPYGIQKEVQKFLAGRTGENARKLAELAAAIKPDDLPKS